MMITKKNGNPVYIPGKMANTWALNLRIGAETGSLWKDWNTREVGL